jgi:hypothetical protein
MLVRMFVIVMCMFMIVRMRLPVAVVVRMLVLVLVGMRMRMRMRHADTIMKKNTKTGRGSSGAVVPYERPIEYTDGLNRTTKYPKRRTSHEQILVSLELFLDLTLSICYRLFTAACATLAPGTTCLTLQVRTFHCTFPEIPRVTSCAEGREGVKPMYSVKPRISIREL